MGKQVASSAPESKVVLLAFGERNMPEGIQEDNVAKFGDLPGHEFHGNQWTDGSAHPLGADREAGKARLSELRATMKPLAEKKFLTGKEAQAFNQAQREYHSLAYDRGKPGTPDNVVPASERMSTLSPETNSAISQDVWRNKDMYLALQDAASGTYDNADTRVDKIFAGQNPRVSAQQMYRNFEGTRAALRSQYGDTVPLFRATGAQKEKITTNWATTREFASQFGKNVVERQTPVDHVLAAYANNKGTYHELIVGDPAKIAKFKAKFGVAPMMLKDAEIFQTGSWPGQGASGIKFSEEDLDAIVSSFGSLQLAGRVPLKLGHDGADARTSDSAPALGWVESVRRSGGKLLADIKLTSDKLAEGIRAGAYKFVSIELLRNVQAHTRQIPWVLDAVALLGATAPAVGTLRDLQTSMQTFSRSAGLRLRGERLAFKREDVNPNNGESNEMDEAAVQAAIAKAVNDATAKFSAQVTDLSAKLEAANGETTKARAQAHRFSVLAPFEAAIKAGVINAAAKDLFVQTNGINDDTKVMLANAKLADEFIDSMKDLPKFKGPGASKRTSVAMSVEDPAVLADKTTAQVMSFRCEEHAIRLGLDTRDFSVMEAANKHVLATDKDLALQYFADPQALYVPPTQSA